MALNSPLLKSLVDKINFKALQSINDNLSYIDTDKLKHNSNDPIHEMLIILWKCYTIYYTLFSEYIFNSITNKLESISDYAYILDKLNENKDYLKIKDNVSEYEKNTKIKELHKLIDRFNYLRTEYIDNKKEKVQICNLFKQQLYKYPFFNIYDNDLKEVHGSIETSNNKNILDAISFNDGILSFILNKTTNELLYIAIIKYSNVFVYDNRSLPIYNQINKKVYNILKENTKITYTPDNIPLLILNKNWRLNLFDYIENYNKKAITIYSTVHLYYEWYNKSLKNKCKCYNLNIPNIIKYTGDYVDNMDTANRIILNTQKHIELIAPYNINANIDMLYYKNECFINFFKDKASKEFNDMKNSSVIDGGVLMIGMVLNSLSDINHKMYYHKNTKLIIATPELLVTDTLKLCFFKYLYHSLHTVYNNKLYKQYILTHYNKIVDLINKYSTIMGKNLPLRHISEEEMNFKN